MSTTTIIIIIIIIITNTDTTVEDMAIPHSARFFLPFIPQVKKNPGNPIVQLLAYSCVAFPFIEEIVFIFSPGLLALGDADANKSHQTDEGMMHIHIHSPQHA